MSKSINIPSSRPPSQRQLRVGEQIRSILSEILLRSDFHDTNLAIAQVSINEVRLSPDLRHARVYALSRFGENIENVIEALNAHAPEMRKILAKQLTLKFLPRLYFVPDQTYFEANKIESLLKSQHVAQDLIKTEDSKA